MGILRKAVGSSSCLVLAVGLGWLLALVAPPVLTSRGASEVNRAVKPAAEGDLEPDAAGPSSPASRPATTRVVKGPFQIEVILSGVFEAPRMSEVSIRPEAWTSPLVVDRAIEHGTPVKKGDILVELDREGIDKAISDAEVENSLTEVALKQAVEELP